MVEGAMQTVSGESHMPQTACLYTPGVYRGYVDRYRHLYCNAIYEGQAVWSAGSSYCKAIDGLISAIACTSVAQSPHSEARDTLALIGLGAYARGALSLHSDVDLLFLYSGTLSEPKQRFIDGILYPLWDSGLRIGHAARCINETLALADNDPSVATTLIDARLIIGNTPDYENFAASATGYLSPNTRDKLLEQLRTDSIERHQRYGDTPFLLEPELKFGKGGLRDLDFLRWMVWLAWPGAKAKELIARKALSAEEVNQLCDAHVFLFRLRNLLHARHKRQSDRLTFEDQEAIAEKRFPKLKRRTAVEALLREYYRAASVIAHACDRVQERIALRNFSAGFVSNYDNDAPWVYAGRIGLNAPERLAEQPALALTLLEKAADDDLDIDVRASDELLRRSASKRWVRALLRLPDAKSRFLALLCHDGPYGSNIGDRKSVRQVMFESGIMAAFVPQLEGIHAFAHHDIYHVYTVDVHTQKAVDWLGQLFSGQLENVWPEPTQIAKQIQDKRIVFLATLLHDIAKPVGAKHSEVGADIAHQVCAALGTPTTFADQVSWLVREHLSLYHWATRRDVAELATLASLRTRVLSEEALKMLYLLTYADLATTHPQALTAWKAHLLDDSFKTLYQYLIGSASTKIESNMQQQTQTLTQTTLESQECKVELKHGPTDDLFSMTLTTRDRPGLLAVVCRVLAIRQWSVLSAQIDTQHLPNGEHRATDTFLLSTQQAWSSSQLEQESNAIGHAILELVKQDHGLEIIAASTGKPSWLKRTLPTVDTRVVIDNKASDESTIIDVFATDRPWLLYTIAEILYRQGLSIVLSKVSTEGAQAIDVFYVQDEKGGKARARTH